jgi:hypothetical protein
MYFLQLLVLITWSLMAIINPVVSGNSLPAFSHVFDADLSTIGFSRSQACLPMQSSALPRCLFLVSFSCSHWYFCYYCYNYITPPPPPQPPPPPPNSLSFWYTNYSELSCTFPPDELQSSIETLTPINFNYVFPPDSSNCHLASRIY